MNIFEISRYVINLEYPDKICQTLYHEKTTDQFYRIELRNLKWLSYTYKHAFKGEFELCEYLFYKAGKLEKSLQENICIVRDKYSSSNFNDGPVAIMRPVDIRIDQISKEEYTKGMEKNEGEDTVIIDETNEF